ncbi:MAG: NADPH:quinone oxidoreductase family protein [Acidimicrobiales bacterium]
MNAVVCSAYGAPENLAVQRIDKPSPGAGQLLVEVKAASVTFPDTLILQNKYQFTVQTPYVPGGQVAGVVADVGEIVTDFSVGDSVICWLGIHGGMAAYAVADASQSIAVPDGLDLADSVGLSYAYGTTLYALKYRAAIQPGETLLVLGAGGNLGLTAVQLGTLLGARVIAAASTSDKLDRAQEAGAVDTINYSLQDLKEWAKELTDGRGVDAVFDVVGGPYTEPAVRSLGWGGRLLTVGFTAGIPSIPLNLTLLKGCQIVGVNWGGLARQDRSMRDAVLAETLELAVAGGFEPQISGRYPLEQAGEALRTLMDGNAMGAIILEPS